jgi:hypothetical protein
MKGAHIAMVVTMVLAASMAGCIGEDAKNKDPLADAGSDVEAEVGEEVVFSGTGLDNDGSIVLFQWDYDGDGEWDWSGEVGSRIHVYDRPGDFEAVLQVEDDEGAKATDTRWVNVTATVFITVNWTSGSHFVVHVSERLSVGNMEVDWTMEGEGPTPITRTFTSDAGLDRLNDTAYTVDPSVDLAPGQIHRVHVRLGEIIVARRTIEVVEVSDADGAYDATYQHSLWDSRTYGANMTQLWRNGTLEVETRIGWTEGVFQGIGSWYTFTNRTGVITEAWVNITDAAALMGLGTEFGEIWWRYSGHGDLNQTGETGFYIFAYIWDFLREMENGSLVKDDWRRVGLYSGANDTNGSFEWNRTTEGNQVRQNGEGDLYEVLKVRSERSFEGTNLGRDFYLRNLTYDYDASRLIFDNRTIFRESLQEVGFRVPDGNWSWSNTSWTGFPDEGGDTVFNPDTLDYDPELAARFIGPRPRVLHVGDAFTATNFYGVTVSYLAKRVDVAPLETLTGSVNVTGVLAEAIFNSTRVDVHHWFWVLEDGPLPGLVFEERVMVDRVSYGGGTYDWYRNIRSVTPFS